MIEVVVAVVLPRKGWTVVEGAPDFIRSEEKEEK